MNMFGNFIRCLAWGIILLALGCTTTSRHQIPTLQPISSQIQQQTPLWPSSVSWRAQGRFVVNLPDSQLAHTLHLVGHAGDSLRLVLMADGGVVVEDTVFTIKDQSLTAKQEAGFLAKFAPALRHSFLAMEEGKRLNTQEIVEHVSSLDRTRRKYAGDPLLLRLSRGSWGWSALGNYQLLDGVLVPHHIYGAVGPIGWELTLQKWETTPE